MLYLKKPENGATVSLATEYQKTFTSDEERARRATLDAEFSFEWNDIKIGADREEHSLPAPVRFEWMDRPNEVGHNNRRIYTYLLISESADMSSPEFYVTTRSSYEVYNLKISTKYYWCVQKNGRRSSVFSFHTASDLPRFIRIGGVSNVRDMGGYPLLSGGVIRQGMVYRGSEFENKMHLSATGVDDISRLGIKTDLDLRGEAIRDVENPTSLILGLKRISIKGQAYEGLWYEDQKEDLRGFFTAFTDPDNYPIYYHCRGGADRTGSYAFILGALLGMTLDDLLLEYELTSLSIWGARLRKHRLFVPFLDAFMALDGESLSDKARGFIRNHAGLSDEEIDRICDILIKKDQ
jgi:hypothetical protein